MSVHSSFIAVWRTYGALGQARDVLTKGRKGQSQSDSSTDGESLHVGLRDGERKTGVSSAETFW